MDTHIISSMKIRLSQDIEGGTACILNQHTMAQIIRCFDDQTERIKELEAVIQAALRVSDLWTLKEVDTMFEDEAKALEVMKQGFEQALKG